MSPSASKTSAAKPARARGGSGRMFGLLRPYRKLVTLSAFTMFLSAGFQLLSPVLFGQAVSKIEALDTDGIVFFGLMVMLAGLLSAITGFFAEYFSGQLSLNVEVELRDHLFDHVVGFDTATFEERPPADLLSRILVASGPIQSFLSGQLPILVRDSFVVVMSAIILFIIDPILALVALWPVPIVIYVSHRFSSRLQSMMMNSQAAQADTTVELAESIDGAELSKKLGDTDDRIARFKLRLQMWFEADRAVAYGNAKHLPIIANLPEIGAVTLLVTGGMFVINGEITLSTLVVFIGFLGLMYRPIENIGGSLWSLLSANGSAARVWEVLEEHSRIADPDDPLEFPPQGTITIDRVTASFTPERNVLDDVAVQVEHGRNAIIIGSPGAGKSALLNLLQRIYDPQAGTLRIGDVAFSEVTLNTLRGTIKYVNSEHHIFPMTIADNIAYGLIDATPEDIAWACDVVGARDWVERLPAGYDTVVGTGGLTLDASMRAQVSLARAVVTRPRILLLDTATSALTGGTERTVAHHLREELPDTSVIAIGNRPGLFELGGEVIILERGMTVAAGDIPDLARDSEPFRELLRASHIDPDSITGASQ